MVDKKKPTVIKIGGSTPGHLDTTLEDLVALEAQLREGSAVARDLGALLAQGEMAALGRRLLDLLDYPVFPHMEPHRRSYPWPLV